MNQVTTDCGCCVYVHNGHCLGPVPCPGIFIPGDVIRSGTVPTHYYDVKKSEVIKAEPMINDDGIWMPEHAYFRADSGCAYRLVMTADMFREAWRRYVKGEKG